MGNCWCKDQPAQLQDADHIGMTFRPKKTWCKAFKKYLRTILSSHQSEQWFVETLQIVESWQNSQDDNYIRIDRWEGFLNLDDGSPNLQFQTGVSVQREFNPRNMFDLLDRDFYDSNSPIGMLIETFTTIYLKQFMRDIEECVSEKNKDEADFWLLSLSILITKLDQVLAFTTLKVYSPIYSLLQSHRPDLEGLLLVHLVHGDLYKLIEDLASVSQAVAISRLEDLTNKDPGHEHDFLTQYVISPPIERACDKIKELLILFSASENFYERRILLVRITDIFTKAAFSEELKPVIVARAIVKANSIHFPAQLFATKQFLLREPESLEVCIKAIAMIVQGST